MNIQIIVGSIREGRVAIKVAKWLKKEIQNLEFSTINVEILDLKEWDLPFFAGKHSPASGIYDQPKQQEWADKIASGDAFIFISPEYNQGYSALQAAAENGYLEIVQLLIQQGADAHYKSEYTALQLAEMADQQQIVEYLMNL